RESKAQSRKPNPRPLRARRGPRVRRDRPADPGRGRARRSLRSRRHPLARAGAVPRPARGSAGPRRGAGPFRPRHFAARSGRARLLVDASVIGGGVDRWRRRLRALRDELELKLRGLGGEDEPLSERLRRTLGDLDALEAYALPLLEELAPLQALRAPWSDWLD